MNSRPTSYLSPILVLSLVLAGAGCGSEEPTPKPASKPASTRSAVKPAAARPSLDRPAIPDDLPQALVLSLASFAPRAKGSKDIPQPLPARMEFLKREGGEWKLSIIEDEQSNVFHKAMEYDAVDGESVILSMAGSDATVKTWRPSGTGMSSTTHWEKDFGGKFSRMRDAEVGDLYGDGKASIAIATHDQGVVAVMRPQADGSFTVEEIDAEPDTFVHEIEIGDLDGDGQLEVYATPSEPNRLDGSPQSGQVVRYVPAAGEGRVVVADLADRHAKEIYVGDVDGDGSDELYVVVEGRIAKGTRDLEVEVEIRRYEADTDPKEGVVIGRIPDRLCRFLTVGDIDGDGKKEMVAAAFSSGLWLLRPAGDPMTPWDVSSIDRNSGGFEHASILADLDGDGRDELYVASDKHKEVRQYVWNGEALVPETIFAREDDGSGIFTWNIMPIPVSMVP